MISSHIYGVIENQHKEYTTQHHKQPASMRFVVIFVFHSTMLNVYTYKLYIHVYNYIECMLRHNPYHYDRTRMICGCAVIVQIRSASHELKKNVNEAKRKENNII